MGQYALTFEVPGEEVESISLWLTLTASEWPTGGKVADSGDDAEHRASYDAT